MVRVTGWLGCGCQQETQTLPITPHEQTEPLQGQVYSLPAGLSKTRLVSLDSHVVDPRECIRLPWKPSPCIYQQFPDLLVMTSFLTFLDSPLQIQLVLCQANPTQLVMSCAQHPPCSHHRGYVLPQCFKQGESISMLCSPPKPWLLLSASPVLLPCPKAELPHHSMSLLRC